MNLGFELLGLFFIISAASAALKEGDCEGKKETVINLIKYHNY